MLCYANRHNTVHISTEDFITHVHKFISNHSAVLYVDETQSGDQGRDLLRVPLRHSVDVCGRASWLADWVVGPSFKKRDPEVMIQLSGYQSPQSPWEGLHQVLLSSWLQNSGQTPLLRILEVGWEPVWMTFVDFKKGEKQILSPKQRFHQFSFLFDRGYHTLQSRRNSTTMWLYCLGIYTVSCYGTLKGSHSPIYSQRVHIPTSLDL